MANQQHLDALLRGVEYWNQWREVNQVQFPELSGADLVNKNLSKANLSSADLSGTDLRRSNLSNALLSDAILNDAILNDAILTSATLSRANLIDANLIDTQLNDANLSGANLSRTDLGGAELHRADLTEVNLSRANLTWSDLSGANLSGAILYQTVFAHNDLSTVKRLIDATHTGPSYVELHTVKLPQDGSAMHFLRETGIPDDWIAVYRSMMMYPVQYHSCFISYAHQDEMLAQRLHADLQDRGVRCWFAPEDMKIGDKIRARIDEAIHVQEKLLLLLSEHSLTSAWVEDEVEIAFEKEQRQHREVLFPVRLDEAVMHAKEAWATKLRRTRHIGNFTHWMNPLAYQQAFECLLRDLKVAKKEEGF